MAEKRYKVINGKRLELTAEEIKFEDEKEKAWADDELNRKLREIREGRKPLFVEADWQINKLNDAKGDSSKWIAYRIKLRDITKGVDTVDKAKAVTMPEKPK